MSQKLHIVLLISFLSLTNLLYSQARRGVNNNYFVQKNIGINYYTGNLISQDKELDSLKNGLINAFEVDLCLGTNGRKYWQNFFRFPSVGFSYMLTDFNYDEVLGTALSIAPYIKFNLINTNGFNLKLKTATGIALFEKKYDSLENRKNVAISSHLNAIINIGLQSNIRLGDRIFFTLGVNALHYSNGSFKKPNYGLNFITTNAGFNLNLNVYRKIPPYFKYHKKEKTRWFLTLAGSIKETGDPGGPKYNVFSLSTEYSKPFKKQYRYGGTIDLMYDNSTLFHFKEDSINYTSKIKALKVGATFQLEMLLDRFSAYGGIGIYLLNHDKKNSIIYQRVGLRYRISDAIYAQIALKTHINFADYIELGISYNFLAKSYSKRNFKDYKINNVMAKKK